MRGLAGRVTVYTRDAGAAHGLALDFMHARPLLSQIEVRGRGLDEIEREDILIITAVTTRLGRDPPRHPSREHRRDGLDRDVGGAGELPRVRSSSPTRST
jgi:malate/lactate dehydrogenase